MTGDSYPGQFIAGFLIADDPLAEAAQITYFKELLSDFVMKSTVVNR